MTTPPHSSESPGQDRGPAAPDASQHAGTPGVPPAQPPAHPGAYGYPGFAGYPMQRPTNGFAIASLVLGILWVWWVGSILALIFGYVARKQIRDRGQSGDGMAIAGIVLGWVGVGLLGLFLVFLIIGTVFGSA